MAEKQTEHDYYIKKNINLSLGAYSVMCLINILQTTEGKDTRSCVL